MMAPAAATVIVSGRLANPQATVPTGVGAVADTAPTAALIDPAPGLTLKVGQSIAPLARGLDDFAVKSAQLLVDGTPVASSAVPPYAFSWTPSSAYAGTTVSLSTVVTDSSGQSTTSAPVPVSVSREPVVPVITTAPPATLPAGASAAGVVKLKGKGTATLSVAVNTVGTLTVSGPKVVTRTVASTGASTVTLPVKATKKFRKKLARKGKLTVDVQVTFTAASGGTVTTTQEIVLVEKHPHKKK